MDRSQRLCERLAACFTDRRKKRFVEHDLTVMLRQRILGLALGYEDINDHDGLSLYPLSAQLRTADRDGSEGALAALQKIIPAIRTRFGKLTAIVVCGDSGFCREEIMAWIESQPRVH